MIIGSGIDVIEIARVERALVRHGDRFRRRVFTDREVLSCGRHGRPAPHFALRFAAKEACMKALGTGWARGVRWQDMETLEPDVGGRLRLELSGAAAERARALGGVRTHLAVSRSRSLALAVVVLEDA